VPGNHEYQTPGAADYFAYFGSRAGTPGQGWYAYDLGSWRIYALNSNCDEIGGCGPGSPQEAWLRADLAANPRACSLAYWHHPLFSSGEHGSDPRMRDVAEALYESGVDVVLSGHDHDYERFAPQSPDGEPDADTGFRQFVVGTGGAPLRGLATVAPNSEARAASTYGLLKLTLRPTSYAWQFVPVAAGGFTETGWTACR
jgi:3',5'-cyclic AMP phosphodiesterase CpdA